MPRDLEIKKESQSNWNRHQSATNWPKLVSTSSPDTCALSSIYLQETFSWHLPPGGLWDFTSGGCWWQSGPSAHAGPRRPSGGSTGCVGSSISGTRGLDTSSCSRGGRVDNGQTSGRCLACCHGADWSHSFDWSPQREGGLAVAPQSTTLSHTLSGRWARALKCHKIFMGKKMCMLASPI